MNCMHQSSSPFAIITLQQRAQQENSSAQSIKLEQTQLKAIQSEFVKERLIEKIMNDMSICRKNHLIQALPAFAFNRLFPYLTEVEMPLGEVIYESGDYLDYAYFPTTCIVSMLYVLENGASAEIAVVGNEGMLGVALFMGGETMPHRAVVQSAGRALRMKKQALMNEFDRSGGRRLGTLKKLLLRYTQALLTQMSQTAVCNRHHTVDQQLCRWLLLTIDRLPSSQLYMTQELIANMLGVRREGVTEAAGKLQKAGLIEYSRGRINVLNRPGLEARSCECYHVVKSEYNRLLQEWKPNSDAGLRYTQLNNENQKKIKQGKILTGSQKANVALEAIKGTRTIHEIAKAHGIQSSEVHQWKNELMKNASNLFESELDRAG